MKKFTAKILMLGINPCVNVPDEVLKELLNESGKTKSPIPVRIKIGEEFFTQTVVKFQKAWRLYLNTPMRKSFPFEIGEEIKVFIAFDNEPRIISMHAELPEELMKNKKAKTTFENLSPYRQKEIVRYINHLKTNESVMRNIKKAIAHLTGNGSFAGRK